MTSKNTTTNITAGDKPISVCFVMLKAYPLFNPAVKSIFGGAEVDVYLMATELAKDKNFQVSCVVADYGQKFIEQHNGVTVIRSLNFDKNPITWVPSLWRALRYADASIYFRKIFSLVTAVVVLFCKYHKKNFVYRTAHTRECDGTYLKRHWFSGKMMLWSLRQAKAVFAQNVTDRNSLQPDVRLPITVIGNAHHIPDIQDKPREMILWVARSAKVKRPELFLQLAWQMPQHNFVMICPQATGDSDGSYDELVTQAGQIDNLRFIQRVPFHEIDDYFQRAFMLVNTSDAEGFPNTFIQACKCATPVLSLNVNPDNFLDKYNCGLCARGDQQLLTTMCGKMLDPDTIKYYGKNARGYAEKNHNIKHIIEAYKTTFRQIYSESV
jgi:glycosyltransferase involved in cell wall biosynthesis